MISVSSKTEMNRNDFKTSRIQLNFQRCLQVNYVLPIANRRN